MPSVAGGAFRDPPSGESRIVVPDQMADADSPKLAEGLTPSPGTTLENTIVDGKLRGAVRIASGGEIRVVPIGPVERRVAAWASAKFGIPRAQATVLLAKLAQHYDVSPLGTSTWSGRREPKKWVENSRVKITCDSPSDVIVPSERRSAVYDPLAELGTGGPGFDVEEWTASRTEPKRSADTGAKRRRDDDDGRTDPTGSKPSGTRPRPTGSCDTEWFRTGLFDFSLPTDFLPGDDDLSAFEFMLPTYMARRAEFADFAVLNSLIDQKNWNCPRVPGRYPPWANGWGRTHRFFLHGLQIAHVFRDLIPLSWPLTPTGYADRGGDGIYRSLCVDLPQLIEDLLDDPRPVFQAGNQELCDGKNCCDEDDGEYGGWAYKRCVLSELGTNVPLEPFKGQRHGNKIRLCASRYSSFADYTDMLLSYGNRSFQYVASGRASSLWDAISRLLDAARLGKLALGAWTLFDVTIIHELAHLLCDVPHCKVNCCPQGLSMFWQARMMALNGVPKMTDATFSDATHDNSSNCGDTNPNDGFEAVWRLDEVGVKRDANAFAFEPFHYPSWCRP